MIVYFILGVMGLLFDIYEQMQEDYLFQIKKTLVNHPCGDFVITVQDSGAKDDIFALLSRNNFAPEIKKRNGKWYIDVPTQ